MTGRRDRLRAAAGRIRQGLTAAAAAIALALLAPACGGSGSHSAVASLSTSTAATTAPTGTSTAAGSPAAEEQDLLAFSACMRGHGAAAFPDPTRNADGSYGFGTDAGRLRKLVRDARTAFDACEPLLARSGMLSAANVQEFRQQLLAYATCMRSHGVPDFPDPNANGRFGGRLKGLDRNTPAFQAAAGACRPLLSKAIGAFAVGGAGG